MSTEDLACCLKCQMTFKTHEELFVHSCVYIKVESNDFEDSKNLDFSKQREFKHQIVQSNPSESDSDYSPKKKKRKERRLLKRKIEDSRNNRKFGEDNPKLEGKKKRGRPKIKKEEPKYGFDEKLDILEEKKKDNLCDGMNLDLTEEFIIFILRQVDELCDNIKNGDPDDQRTIEVNDNLYNAVSCYRSKLDVKEQIKFMSHSTHHDQNQSRVEFENELNDWDDEDSEYCPEISKKKYIKVKEKKRQKRELINDEKFKFVKDQCGKHSMSKMSCMLNMNYSTLQHRIEKEKIKFTEKQGECYFCDLKKSNDAIDKAHLFPLLKYNHDKKRIECAVCNFARVKKGNRGNIFTHIKSVHRNEIAATTASKKEEKPDCRKLECKKLFGIMEGKAFWCAKCVEVFDVPLTKRPKTEPLKNMKLCPECGVSVQHLKTHLEDVHFPEKQICPLYDKEQKNKRSLIRHNKKLHEKVPCSECGKLVGSIRQHMESAHTPNDKQKFKCDICGKGFAANQRLEDHKNVHTGEKPHKCKFCSACFASFGNMRMHERGHLGHKRK